MPHSKYFVVFHEGEKIKQNGQISARYRTQKEALLDAINFARKAARRGHEAQVLAQGEPTPGGNRYGAPARAGIIATQNG